MTLLKGITGKLLLLVAAVSLVPLVIMGSVTFYTMKAQMESNLADVLVAAGHSVATSMDNYILQRNDELSLVSGSSTLRAGDPGKATYELNRYLSSFEEFQALAFVDARGDLQATAGDLLRTRGDSSRESMIQDWFDAARDGKKVLDRVVAERGEFSRYLLFIQPVTHEGRNYGYVFGQVDSEQVAKLASNVEIGETGRATLFNENGKLIGHRDKNRYGYDMSNYSIMEAPLRNNTGDPGAFFTSGDGREKWGLTLLLDDSRERLGLQWGIIVDQTVSEMYAPVNRLNRILWLVGILAFVVAIICGVLFAIRLVSPLHHLLDRLQNISSGDADLNQEIELQSRDEFGEIAEAFNVFTRKLRGIVRQLASENEVLVDSAQQMRARTSNTSQALERQKSEVEQVATAMNEMTATVQDVAKSAQSAASAAETGASETDSGHQVVEQTITSIQELAKEVEEAATVINGLKEESNSIATILDVIRGIADQTNLLALNAAIEAARAGEQGRGFAVVADEVRSLARRTQDSTTEIQKMIDNLQQSAEKAVSVMETGRHMAGASVEKTSEAGQSLSVIAQEIHQINDMNAQIASAAEEQSAVAEEINRNIMNISQLAEETAEGSEQEAKAGKALAELAEEMKGIVNQFRY